MDTQLGESVFIRCSHSFFYCPLELTNSELRFRFPATTKTVAMMPTPRAFAYVTKIPFYVALFLCLQKSNLAATASPTSTPSPTASTTSQPVAAQIDAAKIAADSRPAVALIVVEDKAGKIIKSGTGFFVSSDGKLATNAHILENGATAVAKLENGAVYNVVGVLKAAVEKDLVIAKAEASKVPFLTISTDPLPEPGTRIVVVGSPLGLEGTVSDGIVAGQRLEKRDDQWLQMTAPISPGSSGSPVMNSQGKVIGVATSGVFVIAQGVNFARPAEYISQLLDQITPNTEPFPLWMLAANPKHVLLNDPEFVEAEKAFTNDDPAGALKRLNKLQSKYAENELFLLKLGLVYDRLNLLDDAVQAYQHALKIDPSNGLGWTNLALTYVKLQKFSEAKDAALNAVKQAPDFGPAWGVLGYAYKQQGRFEDAADALQKAAKLTPKDPDVWRNLSDTYAQLNEPARRQEADTKVAELSVLPAPSPVPTVVVTTGPSPPNDRRAVAVVSVPEGNELHLRSEHDANSTLLMTLHKGDRVYLEEGRYRNDEGRLSIIWQKATSMDGRTGWLNATYLSIIPGSEQVSSSAFGPTAPPQSDEHRPVAVVTADDSNGLNVRSAPDAKSKVLTVLRTQDRVYVGSGHIRNNEPPHPQDWQQITTMSGQNGWFAADYLSGPEGESHEGENQQVWKLFERWMVVNSRADPVEEAALYSDPTDYLEHGTISRQQLTDELRADLQRWPTQFNRVSRGPDVEKLNDSEWRVSFEISFDVRNPAELKRVNGTANLTWTVRKGTAEHVEITSAKEQVTSRTFHDVKRMKR